MATQNQVQQWIWENRDRTTPFPAHLRAQIEHSSAAWFSRFYEGIQPLGLREIGELIPPGYLDTPCTKCGHLPGVEILENGNMVSNGNMLCHHIGCSECGFPPPEMWGSECIFQTYLAAAPVLNATRSNLFLQQTPVSAENLAFLQRHGIPDFWRGANPVPEFWRDLRIAYDQLRAYTENNNPRHRQTFEEEIAREGLDPWLCRRRVIELRLLQQREAGGEAVPAPTNAERVRANVDRIRAHAERVRAYAVLARAYGEGLPALAERVLVYQYNNRVERFLRDLPGISYGKLAQGQECSICLIEFAFQDPREAGRHMPVRTPCGHIFGADCLEKWLKATVGNGCPVCRTQFMSNATRQGTGNSNHQAALNNNNQQAAPNHQGIGGAQNQQLNQGTQNAQNRPVLQIPQGAQNQQINHHSRGAQNQQVRQGVQSVQNRLGLQVPHGALNQQFIHDPQGFQDQQVHQAAQDFQYPQFIHGTLGHDHWHIPRGAPSPQLSQDTSNTHHQHVNQARRPSIYGDFRPDPSLNRQINTGTQSTHNQYVNQGTRAINYRRLRPAPRNPQLNQGTQSTHHHHVSQIRWEYNYGVHRLGPARRQANTGVQGARVTRNIRAHQNTPNNTGPQVSQPTPNLRSAQDTTRDEI